MNPEAHPIPTLTSAQVAEIDRLAADRFELPVEWLMEAAGWQVARHCRGKTAVLCGKGSNGGDGLAAARHLHRWGRLHSVAALDRGSLKGAAARMAGALEAVGVEITDQPRLDGSVLVLDAIFGTGLNRPPEGTAAAWIEAINSSGIRVLAVDLPSGLDADDGRALTPAVRADVTVTLGLPKAGLLTGDGPALAGQVWLADIGIPAQAYEMVGAAMPAHLFSMHDRVQLGAVRL
ncbi:MAG: NAD(P)H-hydrate epimerase [Candidatus Dormibacteraeota bacterium]|nr:NAD(P)H-hydrate epimerase [Candidatus Dormibacteraeota bacterium]